MKYNKKSAFTMSEVMVLLLTLTVLMAAFAPAITKRQTSVSFDDVWTFVSTDDNNDAYFDAINRVSTSQAFIGVTPEQGSDVPNATFSGSNETLYSKLVIRPSDRVGGSNKQMQMQFRYGDNNNGTGTRVGGIFADGSNFLVGGIYGSIKGSYSSSGSISSGAAANTSLGSNTLNALQNGIGNTAVGTGALQKLSDSSYNTAVGYKAGYSLTSGSYNTLIGYKVLNNKSAKGSDNTFVGANVASDPDKDFSGYSNTAFGSNAMHHISSGYYNTAVGYKAGYSLTSGSYNTAIGYNALNSPITGSNNTAVGYNAGSPYGLTVGSNKTFVGYFSGSNADGGSYGNNVYSSLFTDSNERVFIGALPRESVADGDSDAIKQRPGAVLEVHNIDTKSNVAGRSAYTPRFSSYEGGAQFPIQKVGYSSVVVNGNLIVRGQPYFETPLWRPYSIAKKSTGSNPPFPTFKTSEVPKGLVAYRLYEAVKDKSKSPALKFKVLNGYDGAMRTAASYQSCNRRRDKYNRHHFSDIRENCICTASSSSYKTFNTAYLPKEVGVSTSYDWTSLSSGNVARTGNYSKYNPMGASYTDSDVGGTVTMERNPSFRHERMDVGTDHDNGSLSTDFPLAHPKTGKYEVLKDKTGFSSCCPNLKSDARLKNIGEEFTAGLDELKKLHIYNFTFKNDSSQMPHVGVMAQDLKLVFPNAVSKDDNGYYQIRWDEMLYAVINSVKSLNSRIENLAHKVADDTHRLVLLKKNNVKLNAKLDKLESEIAQLETKK